MSDKDLFEAIKKSLEKLGEQDFYLLKHDISERAIAHRLAFHFNSVIPYYDIDCEYNGAALRDPERKRIFLLREEMDAIGLLSKKEMDIDTNVLARSVYPDIIVHKRGLHDFNKCVIEIKKSTSEHTSEYDTFKLKAYTSGKLGNYLSYQLGVFIEIKTLADEFNYTLRFYKDGNVTELPK